MFYIYDCTGSLVGNPKGYKTFRGAANQTQGRAKVCREIWARFYSRVDQTDNHIFSVSQDTPTIK